MKNIVKSLFTTIALMAIVVSCGKEPSQPAVAVNGVTLSPESIDIEIGDQKSLTATVSPSDATNKNISFSSSKESVATVSQDGIVEAKSAGKAIVTVTTKDGNYKAHCTVNVLEKVVHVTGIALNKTILSMKEGDEFTLVPTVTPDDAADKSVNWSSDNEAIVTISDEGTVKALKAGKATVTATTVDQGKTATCSIEVTEGMSAVTGSATHISCCSAEIAGKANLPGTTSTDLSFGVLYSTSSGVLVGSSTQIEAKEFDSDYNYTVNTEVLEPETTYYYRSYIIQDKEISYGELKSFSTLAVSSMIQTLDATDINPRDAVLNASLDLTDCKYDALEYGFEITPEGGSAYTVKSSNHSEKKFSAKDESLSRDTKYSVIAYVKLDGRAYKGEAKTFTTLKPSCPSGAVDLGLSVYWATCNLGASMPEEYGGFYQWAGLDDVTDTSIYLYWNNCPYHAGSSSSIGWTKYIPSGKSSYWSGTGSPDNKTVLDPEDDVAHVKLGGKWRMPTIEEWTELRNTSNCSWIWTSINGINGYKVQSKKAGFTNNWIFLPAAGYRSDGLADGVGSNGNYWFSSLNTDYPDDAYHLYFDSVGVYTSYDRRYLGQSVRPVSE